MGLVDMYPHRRFVRTEDNRDKMIITAIPEKDCCNFTLFNSSSSPVCVNEAILYEFEHRFADNSRIYTEGYNMLSQTGGTIAHPQPIGEFTDDAHYRMPQTEGFFVGYNVVCVFDGSMHYLFGFASCNRFRGEIRFNKSKMQLALCLEGIEVQPGETVELETVFSDYDESREQIFDRFAACITSRHSIRLPRKIPTGWCSWYCYGADISEENIEENLTAMAERIPFLRHVQIDDGYQAHMGDWFTMSDKFNRNMGELCRHIRDRGMEPAVWVAPFIAEKDSRLLREHPEYFVQDDEGHPLCSGEVTFGGWRNGPWYMLDGSNPQTCRFLTDTFRKMRESWGCRYFKLDANVWGAMPFGRRFDASYTSVEAYRAGMAAIRLGAGEDSFLVGCNAPMWPSIGLVDAMRVTGDVARCFPVFRMRMHEGLYRNWQNGRLWINDPDCVVLEPQPVCQIGGDGQVLSAPAQPGEDEYTFHYAYLYAVGGMVFSGDALSQANAGTLEQLKQLVSTQAHERILFDREPFCIGKIRQADGWDYIVFNEWAEPMSHTIFLDDTYVVREKWGDGKAGACDVLHITVPPHSARILECKRMKERVDR